MENFPNLQPVVLTVLTSVFDFKEIDFFRINDPYEKGANIRVEGSADGMTYNELIHCINNNGLLLKKVKLFAKNDISDDHPFLNVQFLPEDLFAGSDNNSSMRCYDIHSNSVHRVCMFQRVAKEEGQNNFAFELMSFDDASREATLTDLKPFLFSNDCLSYVRIKNLPANNFYTFYFYFEKQ
jgi:hypothetical protein